MRLLKVGRHLRHVRPVEVVHVESEIRRRLFCRLCRLGHVGKDFRCRGVLLGRLKLALLRLEVRLDALAGQVVGEVGGAAPSLAPALAVGVAGLVAPAHGLLSGLLVDLAGLGPLDAANLQLLEELLHVARMVAGVRHAVAQNALEGLDAELPLALGPCGRLPGGFGTHDGEPHLAAQPVVLALHGRMVGAVRDGRAGYQVMVRDGRMDVHAAALAVGVDRDPAGSVRGHFLAQEVAVFARPLDVLGAVPGKLFGGPRDAQLVALVQPRPLALPAHGGAEPDEVLAGAHVAHLGGDAVRLLADIARALLALPEFRVRHAPADVRQGLDVRRRHQLPPPPIRIFSPRSPYQ